MQRSLAARAFAVGLLLGLGGEALLFLRGQGQAAEEALREDFRVVFFLKEDMPEGRLKVLEEQVRALPEVEEARAVTSREALAALRREEPELVESILLLKDNPLNPAVEVRLSPSALGGLLHWVEEAKALTDWADIRYKGSQVQAALQAQFYAHFIDLTARACACVLAALFLAWLWARREGTAAWKTPAAAAALSVLGAAAGAACVLAAALPMRELSPWWAWPQAAAQASLLLSAAAAGCLLCERR